MGATTFEPSAGSSPAGPGFRRGLIVANEAAGDVSPELVEEVRSLCCRSLSSAVVTWTASADGVVDQVRGTVTAERDAGRPMDVVVAVGGDGTVRDVAEALARASGGWPEGGARESGPALFVVPAGSGNSAYAALWGTRPWQDALASALDEGAGRLRSLDLGNVLELGRATFLGVNAGFGVTARKMIARAQSSGDEADWAAVNRVFDEVTAFPGRVTVDATVLYEGPVMHLVVGGVERFVSGLVRLLPRSRLDDGQLDVCVFTPPTEAELGELASLVPLGEHLGHPAVRYAQGRRVTVEATAPDTSFPVDSDGDVCGTTHRLTVEAVPAALTVMPASATEA